MHSLYPLKFKPLFKNKIWGGNKIKELLGMDVGELPNCGEAWLISGVEGNTTIVNNGYLAKNELNELVEVFMGDLVGDQVYDRFGDVFPILLKIIDANDWLSVQVHPDDKLAKLRRTGVGKTEMWYILQADEGARLITGFNHQTDKQSYMDHLNSGRIKEILNFEDVIKGNVFYIPAGRIHALGPGCLLAEIQQTSDTTYRIYDWDRKDINGNSRQLHTKEALDAIDFEYKDNYKTQFSTAKNTTSNIIKSPFFTSNYLNLDQAVQKDYTETDSFVILFCSEGGFELIWEGGTVDVRKADAILIPNIINQIQIKPVNKVELLEVYIE